MFSVYDILKRSFYKFRDNLILYEIIYFITKIYVKFD